MREVPKDDKWRNEQSEHKYDNDPSMDEQVRGLSDYADRAEARGNPSEAELITISLLMRLYDLNMAILNAVDQERADAIFEAHEEGIHFNPVNLPIPEWNTQESRED